MQTAKWFNYSAAETILQRLQMLIEHPPTHRMPGLLILGDSNSGKTSLGLEFLSRHPVDPNLDGDAVRVPVLRMEVPPNPDESRIYDEILVRLLQPFRSKDPISVKARQVRTVLNRVLQKSRALSRRAAYANSEQPPCLRAPSFHLRCPIPVKISPVRNAKFHSEAFAAAC
ncbi:MAG: TniB family NTP-binding protein [Lysobacterales bacterium]